MDAIAALYGSDNSDVDDASAQHPTIKRRASDSGSTGSEEESESRENKRSRRGETPPPWTRAFAHVDGNWPSHVKVDIPQSAELLRVVDRIVQGAQELVGGDIALIPMQSATHEGGLHLSLSRPFVLTFDQIEIFIEALRGALKWRPRFQIALDRAVVLANDDATRSFLALCVTTGSNHVRNLLKCVDKCMREFGLQTYYEDPIPHVSIASALGDSLRVSLPSTQLDQLLARFGEETCPILRVISVQVVIGNKHFHIPLR